MTEDAIIGAVMGAALIFVMFSMGLQLTWLDFRRVALMPGAVFLGMVAQMIVLPAIALAAVYLVDLPAPAAIGILLVAICPGGPVSNFFSHISGGNAALSVTLTMMTTLSSIVTLPAFFLWTPLGEYAQGTEVPALYILKSLFIGVVVPTVVGMIVRAFRHSFAVRIAQRSERLGLFLIFVVLSLILYKNRAFYGDITAGLLVSVAAVNVGGMLGGYALGAMFAQPRSTKITFAYEVGLQNIPLATVLAFGLFANDPRQLTIIAAVVGLYAVASIIGALGGVFAFKQLFPVATATVGLSVNHE